MNQRKKEAIMCWQWSNQVMHHNNHEEFTKVCVWFSIMKNACKCKYRTLSTAGLSLSFVCFSCWYRCPKWIPLNGKELRKYMVLHEFVQSTMTNYVDIGSSCIILLDHFIENFCCMKIYKVHMHILPKANTK